MKIIKLINKLAILIAVALTFSACDEELKTYPVKNEIKSISDILTENGNLSIFSQALEITGVNTTLSNGDNYTVFAPTNDAFNTIFTELGVTGLDEIENLESIVLYHIKNSSTADFAENLTTGYITMALTDADDNDLSLHVNTDNEGIVVNGTASTVDNLYDLGATNGVVHAINSVLIPPTIPQISEADSNFSTFTAALKQVALDETLKGNGPFLVFAPTNEAFDMFMASVQESLGYSSLSEIPNELLMPLLQYHVVPDSNAPIESINGASPTTLQGEQITVDGNSILDISEVAANIITSDIQYTNGKVQTIDKVLLTNEFAQVVKDATLSIYERAEDGGYTMFIEAATIAGIDTELKSTTEYTAFIPTNDGFVAFLGGLENFSSLSDFDTDEEKAVLKSLLEYHLLAGKTLASGLTDGLELTTVQGETIDVENDGAISLKHKLGGPASILTENIGATNGVIHIVNKIMLNQEVVDALGLAPSTEPEYGYEIYNDELNPAFWVGGWGGSEDFASTEVVKSGEFSIKRTTDAWSGFQIGGAGVDLNNYSTVNVSLFAVNEGKVKIVLNEQWDFGKEVSLPAGEWVEVSIPITEISNGTTVLDQFVIQEFSGISNTIYIDEAGLDVVQPVTIPTFLYEIYTESLNSDHWTGGWGGTDDFENSENPSTGDYSIKHTFTDSWSGFQIGGNDLDLSSYVSIDMSLFCATEQKVTIVISEKWDNGKEITLEAGKWNHISVPLSEIKADATTLTQIVIQEFSGNSNVVLYIDDLGLN